ncbi:MAG TPA: hypothetical protein VF719_13220, partial [Abditibacteriaceae bacterium]
KLDAVPKSASGQGNSVAHEEWRCVLGIAPDAPFFIAGSTHPGEEETLIRVYFTLREKFPALRLLIAPRHIERAEEVEKLVRELGAQLARRSGKNLPSDAIILLDTVGELSQVYAAADVAFVGGSLIERGGHNMLEPVLLGVPVTFGPYVANFREAAALVDAARAGRMVHNENELGDALAAWLGDENERRAVALRAGEALDTHRGAAKRVAQIVAAALATK